MLTFRFGMTEGGDGVEMAAACDGLWAKLGAAIRNEGIEESAEGRLASDGPWSLLAASSMTFRSSFV